MQLDMKLIERSRDLPLPRSPQPFEQKTYQEKITPIPLVASPEVDITNKVASKRWKAAKVVSGVIFVFSMVTIISIQGLTYKQISSSPNIKKYPASSCNELLKEGMRKSGIYDIKPEREFEAIEAYCDMETDGGGWTLVASIHESDITKKCDDKDRWANYKSSSEKNNNWENKKYSEMCETVQMMTTRTPLTMR
uniref:fibroleukin-like n=1 Tax=Styela clava TaxID=7725 RepID=UPI0019399419|nr:fibroleukin-like [Styela clava]